MGICYGNLQGKQVKRLRDPSTCSAIFSSLKKSLRKRLTEVGQKRPSLRVQESLGSWLGSWYGQPCSSSSFPLPSWLQDLARLNISFWKQLTWERRDPYLGYLTQRHRLFVFFFVVVVVFVFFFFTLFSVFFRSYYYITVPFLYLCTY